MYQLAKFWISSPRQVHTGALLQSLRDWGARHKLPDFISTGIAARPLFTSPLPL